jgi:hypothetical protein
MCNCTGYISYVIIQYGLITFWCEHLLNLLYRCQVLTSGSLKNVQGVDYPGNESISVPIMKVRKQNGEDE